MYIMPELHGDIFLECTRAIESYETYVTTPLTSSYSFCEESRRVRSFSTRIFVGFFYGDKNERFFLLRRSERAAVHCTLSRVFYSDFNISRCKKFISNHHSSLISQCVNLILKPSRRLKMKILPSRSFFALQ